MRDTEKIFIPFPVRKKFALRALAGYFAISLVVLLLVLFFPGLGDQASGFALAAAPAIGGVVMAARYLLTQYQVVQQEPIHPTPSPLKAEPDVFDRLLERWYVRYPLAGVVLWAAAYLMDVKDGKFWWLSVVAGLLAIVLMRELAFFMVTILAVVLLFQGMAALPVSVAIIVGALINRQQCEKIA